MTLEREIDPGQVIGMINRRVCIPVKSPFQKTLDSFIPVKSFCNNNLSWEDLEEVSSVVNKRRPYSIHDFPGICGEPTCYFVPDLSDI